MPFFLHSPGRFHLGAGAAAGLLRGKPEPVVAEAAAELLADLEPAAGTYEHEAWVNRQRVKKALSQLPAVVEARAAVQEEAAERAAALQTAAEQAAREKSERMADRAKLVAELSWQFGCSKCDYRSYGKACKLLEVCKKVGPKKLVGMNAWGRKCSCRQLCGAGCAEAAAAA